MTDGCARRQQYVMRSTPEFTRTKRWASTEDHRPLIVYAPPSYRRLSSAHTELNKTARILGAGLATVQALSGCDYSGDVISAVVRKVSPHWGGNLPFADVHAETPIAIASVSRLLLVQVVASFEQFIVEAEAECSRVLSGIGENDGAKLTRDSKLTWSSTINRYTKICEKLAPPSSPPAPAPAPGSSSEDLKVVGEMFVRLRHRVAHTSNEESASSLEEILDSEELCNAWSGIAEDTASKRIPFLDFKISKTIPVLELPHAVLASVVFHRLAGLQKRAFLSVDAERRVLKLAVGQMMEEKSLPVTPDKRARRVSYFLGQGGCTRWSSSEIIQALKRAGLWDTCLHGLKGLRRKA